MGASNPLISQTSSDKARLYPALAEMLRQAGLRTDNCLPAIVQSYDRANNVATVQPLIMWVTVDGNTMSRSPIAQVQVYSFGGGGFHINFPLKPGDLGWIVSTDRDISQFKQSLKESAPNSGRAHRFDDCWFLPDVMKKYTVNSEDSAAMVIQSTDAATRIALFSDHVKITSPSTMIVDSPLVQFTHDVEVQGNLTVDVNSHVKGNETVDGTLTNNGINVTTHGHQSTSPGTRTSNMEP